MIPVADTPQGDQENDQEVRSREALRECPVGRCPPEREDVFPPGVDQITHVGELVVGGTGVDIRSDEKNPIHIGGREAVVSAMLEDKRIALARSYEVAFDPLVARIYLIAHAYLPTLANERVALGDCDRSDNNLAMVAKRINVGRNGVQDLG